MLSVEKQKELMDELAYLKDVMRLEIYEKVKKARKLNLNLLENEDYNKAKEEQTLLDARIASIEKMLNEAEIIDE